MVTRQDLQQLCAVPERKSISNVCFVFRPERNGGEDADTENMRKLKVNAQTLVNEGLGWST